MKLLGRVSCNLHLSSSICNTLRNLNTKQSRVRGFKTCKPKEQGVDVETMLSEPPGVQVKLEKRIAEGVLKPDDEPARKQSTQKDKTGWKKSDFITSPAIT